MPPLNVNTLLAGSSSSSFFFTNSGGVPTNFQKDQVVISCAQVVPAIQSKCHDISSLAKSEVIIPVVQELRVEEIKIGPSNVKRPHNTPSLMSVSIPEQLENAGVQCLQQGGISQSNTVDERAGPQGQFSLNSIADGLPDFNIDVILQKEKSKPKRSTTSAFDRQIFASNDSMEVLSIVVERDISSNTDEASLRSKMANNVSLNGGYVNKREYKSNDKVSNL